MRRRSQYSKKDLAMNLQRTLSLNAFPDKKEQSDLLVFKVAALQNMQTKPSEGDFKDILYMVNETILLLEWGYCSSEEYNQLIESVSKAQKGLLKVIERAKKSWALTGDLIKCLEDTLVLNTLQYKKTPRKVIFGALNYLNMLQEKVNGTMAI